MTEFTTTPRKDGRKLRMFIPAKNRDELIDEGWVLGDEIKVTLSVVKDGEECL